MNNLTVILNSLYMFEKLTPMISDLLLHYEEIINAGTVTDEDKEKAKKLLGSAKWEEWK